MAGPDHDLTYYYDDPLTAARRSPRGARETRVGGRRAASPASPTQAAARDRAALFQALAAASAKAIGDTLVALTSADGALVGSKHERHRYATVGMLMLITTAQAFYAATLFFSIGLSKPFRSVISSGSSSPRRSCSSTGRYQLRGSHQGQGREAEPAAKD